MTYIFMTKWHLLHLALVFMGPNFDLGEYRVPVAAQGRGGSMALYVNLVDVLV